MLPRRNEGSRGEGVPHDNGRLSGAWDYARPSNVGILRVASQHLGSIHLNYVTRGVLITANGYKGSMSTTSHGQSRHPGSTQGKQ